MTYGQSFYLFYLKSLITQLIVHREHFTERFTLGVKHLHIVSALYLHFVLLRMSHYNKMTPGMSNYVCNNVLKKVPLFKNVPKIVHYLKMFLRLSII